MSIKKKQKPVFYKNREEDIRYLQTENKEFNDIFDKVCFYVGHSEETDTFTLQQTALQLLGKDRFKGVYPYNILPVLKNGESAIINTDSHDKAGEHWTAIYRNSKKQFYFFDSYGREWQTVIPNLKHISSIGVNSDISSTQTVRQSGIQTYCGQMSLSWLIYLYAQPKHAMALVI